MIKCEVVVRGNKLNLNGFLIIMFDEWEVIKKEKSDRFDWLDDAIKYCLEN